MAKKVKNTEATGTEETTTKKTQKLVYDANKMAMVPLTSETRAKKSEHIRLSLDAKLSDKLVAFADLDGVDRSADSATGQKVKTTNVVRKYVEIAVAKFIADREKLAAPEAGEPAAE